MQSALRSMCVSAAALIIDRMLISFLVVLAAFVGALGLVAMAGGAVATTLLDDRL